MTKRLLLLTALSASVLLADSGTKLIFNIQTNSPACMPGTGLMYGCLPKQDRLAGVMALAKSDDPSVTAFRFTVTATRTSDGSTITKTEVVAVGSPVWPYTPVIIWVASEVSDFSNVGVSVVALRDSGSAVAGTVPGIEY
jgi:hypothetical protein